jgi:hypothetical protein
MSYEVVAVFNQTLFSNDAKQDVLDSACTRPPARDPDTPSTR